jgi:hypothetical protein
MLSRVTCCGLRPCSGVLLKKPDLREDHGAGMASAFWWFVALLLKKSKVQMRIRELQA